MQPALHTITQLLPGNKIEIQVPEAASGDTVEVFVILLENQAVANFQSETPQQVIKDTGVLSPEEIQKRLEAAERTSGIWANLPDNGWEYQED